jgi:hypothetical protein
MKELPEEWRKVAQDLKRKYEGGSWKDIRIGLPDFSNSPTPNIFVYGTPPSGDRVYCIATQDEAGFRAIDQFLSSK